MKRALPTIIVLVVDKRSRPVKDERGDVPIGLKYEVPRLRCILD